MPLHAQLRTAFERLIKEHFRKDDRFFSESQLISNPWGSRGTVCHSPADLAQRGLWKKAGEMHSGSHQTTRAPMQNIAVYLPDFSSPSLAEVLGHLNSECLVLSIPVKLEARVILSGTHPWEDSYAAALEPWWRAWKNHSDPPQFSLFLIPEHRLR